MRAPNPRFGGSTPAEVRRRSGGKRTAYDLELLRSGFDKIAVKMLMPGMKQLRRQLRKAANMRESQKTNDRGGQANCGALAKGNTARIDRAFSNEGNGGIISRGITCVLLLVSGF